MPGISPDIGKPMYTTPADAPLTMSFNKAQKDAKKLGGLFHRKGAHGHQDWRLPSKAELDVLFNNCAKIGGFNVKDSGPAGWYRSSSSDDKWDAWCQSFGDGLQFNYRRDYHSSVRFVR